MVPLHVHTDYSLLDSTAKPVDYINICKRLGMKALAFTEHGNIYNWIKKKQLCDKENIKYIHGVELYMTETLEEKLRDNYHVILLAKNKQGVLEINELCTIATDENHKYYQPRISFDEFLNISDNVITLSACLGGPLAKLDKEHEYFDRLVNKFDFLEVQPHNIDRQREYNLMLASLGKPLIATGDFHEVDEYGIKCREILMIAKNQHYDEVGDLTFKSRDEMISAFKEQGVLTDEQILCAIENTNKVADMVEDFELDYSFKYSQFLSDAADVIREKCYKKIQDVPNFDEYVDRIEEELEVFEKQDMFNFMLFMAEVKKFSNDNNIPVGPGRGSVTGSLVAYLLGITDVNPMVWGTSFPRFANVDRISLGDIDTDYCPRDRKKVYDFIRERFTDDKSSYITTFGQLKVKSIIDNVGKALNMDLDKVAKIKSGYEGLDKRMDRIEKNHENGEYISEFEYEQDRNKCRDEIDKYLSQYDDIFYYYKGLKGVHVSAGIHACFTGDTLITTKDGYKRIDEIEVGDMVLTHNNRYRKVINTMNRKADDRVNVITRRNKIRTTQNHPFLCMDSEDGEKYWCEAKDLNGKYIAQHSINRHNDYTWTGVDIKINQFKTKHVNDLTKDIYLSKEFMYFVGRFIGDGWVQHHPKRAIITLCCSLNEKQEIIDILSKLKYKYQIQKTRTTYKFTINNRELTEFMKQFGRGASNKIIPEWIFGIDKSLQKSLIDGYLSADGYIKGNAINFNSVSRKLIYGMASLSQIVYGNPCSIFVRRKAGQMKIEERIVNTKESYGCCFSKENAKFFFIKDDMIWTKAKVVEDNEDTSVYNLSVEEDNSYCANNIIVHNCGIIGAPVNIRENIGLRYDKGNSKWVSQCDMKSVDSLNYTKYDILSLKTLQVIKDTCELAGIPMINARNIEFDIPEVMADMVKSPVGIFQFESDSAFAYLKEFGPMTTKLIAFITAVIRPSCASFREKAIGKVLNKNPSEKIDGILKETLGYLVYQEQQIAFLQELCGFTGGQADTIRRAIGKKDKALLDEWLPKIEEGYIRESNKDVDVAKEECQSFMQIFMDAANYSFSYNHAIAYSMITYMTAYCRYFYPREFCVAYLNNATNDDDIINGTKLAKLKGISIRNPEFGKSIGAYSIGKDKNVYKGIGSVLNVSNLCADALMDLYNKKYSQQPRSFLELLSDAKNIRDINKTKIRTLIRIGFFKNFGKGKTLEKFFDCFGEYSGRKTLKKETIKKATERIVNRLIKNNVEGFSETTKQYKIVGDVLLKYIWKEMRQVEYTKLEKIGYQLSYLSYIQDDELKEVDIRHVQYIADNGGVLCVKLNGNKQWLRFNELPAKDSYIIVKSTGKQKLGRYTSTVVLSYDTIQIDRKKRNKK